MANTLRVVVLCLIYISEVATFIFQKNLDLKNHNFAFLTSFCGQPTGAILEYKIEFPKINCCPSLLNYYESQWWQIWPDPHKNCTDKQNVLRTEWGQVLKLRTDNPTAGCTEVKMENEINTRYIACKGKHYYQVDSYNPRTPKCWFIAANHCHSLGLKINYTFNITGAYYNSAQRNHISSFVMFLLTGLLAYLMHSIYIPF